MSYDLHGFRVPPGRTVEDWYEDEEREQALIDADPTPSAEERAEMERLAAAVHAVDPSAERHDTGEHIEFTNADAVQVSIFREEAGISVPYWYEGERAEAVMVRMQEYAGVLTQLGGLTFYDPQTGETVTGPGTSDAYDYGVRATQGIAERIAAEPPPPPPTPPKKRGWLSKLTRRD